MVLAIFTDLIPLRLRPKYWAAIQAAWAVGTVAGPVIGGACAHPTTWRWVFYINFPLCAISLVAVLLLYRPEGSFSTVTQESFLTKSHRLDFVGYGLFLGSTTSFLIGITWGGVQYNWDSAQVIVPIILGLAGIAFTITWEKWGTESPFLPIWIFEDFRTTATYLGGMLQGLIVRAIHLAFPESRKILTDHSSSLPKRTTSLFTSKA